MTAETAHRGVRYACISMREGLLPLDKVEALILSIVYGFYHWRGTFLGYDYRRLVEVNIL